MKNIGKLISFYFFALAICSFLAMIHILLIQKQTHFECSWVFYIVFGSLMRKHSNTARHIVIGFNVLCLVLLMVILSTGAVSPENSESLSIFSIEIKNPTQMQLWGFITYFVVSSAVLVILLMTRQAKKEFLPTAGL